MALSNGAQVATDRALRVLEFDAVRQLLGRCMRSALGRSLLPTVAPLGHLALIRHKQRQTSEAKALLLEGLPPSLQQLVDPRPLLDQVAQQGKVLEPRDLLDLQDLLVTARQVQQTFAGMTDRYPRLASLTQPMEVPESLERTIGQVVEARGEVKDRASPRLQEIRRELQETRERVKRILERHLTRHKEVVQEPLITLRHNRYVIPLRPDYRRVLPGIVHDHSTSKATVFVEPLDVLELNNQVVELTNAEEVEVHRILRQMTTAVWEVQHSLRQIAETLAELDYILARARLSQLLRCHEPTLVEDGRLELIQARHPLLVAANHGSLEGQNTAGQTFDPVGAPGASAKTSGPPLSPLPEGEGASKRPIVPCTLVMSADTPTLVITGPNTGGKTVLLKTVGLLSLMAQTGLHIPAEQGSQLPLFHRVLVDIGDEQSLEQSLSTFSAHMRHIVTFLNEADTHALVLLDELGAGTDPAEGAALGIAILEHLHRRGATTLVTTHQNAVKTHAFLHPQMETAAMEFDAETLQPTFHVSLGRFGGSNALTISQRLGLPPEVLATARTQLNANEQRLVEVADRLQGELRILDQLRRQVEQEHQALTHARAEYETRLAGIRVERRRQLTQAVEQGKQLLVEARSRLDEAIEQVRRQGVTLSDGMARQLLRQVEVALEAAAAEGSPPEAATKPLRPGEAVWLRRWRVRGVVLSWPASGNLVEVQAGQRTLKVPLSQLEPLGNGELPRRTQPSAPPALRTGGMADMSSELNLIGWRIEDALPQLEKYLDRAVAAGLQRVRIIHGKGSGRLRAAVHQMLTSQSQVKAFIPCGPAQGGWGATAVELDV